MKMLKRPVSKDVATIFRAAADRIIRLAQKQDYLHHDRHVRPVPIFKDEDDVYPDIPSFFRFAAERSAAEGFNKLLPTKQRQCKVVVLKEYTLQIIQDG